MGGGFVHLNVHSEYSLLEAACRIKPLVEEAKRLGMQSLALTDRGNMFGAVEFYREAQRAGIKPIIGCELWIDRGREGGGSLLLYAADMAGYRNLIHLVTAAHLEHSFQPRGVPLEVLAARAGGLIAASGAGRGEIGKLLSGGMAKQAAARARELAGLFGPENFYLEVQDHGLDEERKLRALTVELARETGLPLLATNDVYYIRRADSTAHDILGCIRTNTHQEQETRERLWAEEYYLKSAEEMAERFADLPEALENTVRVAERCGLELKFGEYKYPKFPVPEGQTREGYLWQLCTEGLRMRYGERAVGDPELQQRLEYELGVIERMGFTSYFLIVWDFIRFAKESGIPVGPGRGSGAGSLVAYVLRITDLDPLRYGLIFERFLNPERISPPDIDVDFCQDRRGEVIRYVREKYGDRSVAQIVTYGTLGAKMAVRDVARVQGLSFTEASRIADQIPKDPTMTIDKALGASPDFKRLYDEEERARQCIDVARSLEGMVRQTGTHAAGVVIADGELTEYLPLTRDDFGNVMTQYEMNVLDALGLLKMDFLGLKTLTVIRHCVDLVKQQHGVELDIGNLPQDDPKTYALLNQGRNIGVFQVESPGMRNLCRRFDVKSVDDIIALIALYRPGPMDLIPEYIECKKGREAVTYLHPLLEELSADTYGFLIYQEQVMKAAQVLAGYTLGEADLLRRAMGKKKKSEMDAQRERFVKGCLEANRIPRRKGEEIFALLEKFAGYGFNKSHSAAYGLISYQTGYLKANYPLEFLTALLINDQDDTDKIAIFLNDAREMDIPVRPPCVNHSLARFSIEHGAIRYGLAAIKGVGTGAAEAIVAARGAGAAFESLGDFCRRVEFRAINKKTVEALIRAGAFDAIHPNRAGLFALLDESMATASVLARDKEAGQETFFTESVAMGPSRDWLKKVERHRPWDPEQCLKEEKALLGYYFSGHPIDAYEDELRSFRTHLAAEIGEESDRVPVRLAGIIAAKEVRVSKKSGKQYARVLIEDGSGQAEFLLFEEALQAQGAKIEVGKPVLVQGSVDRSRNDEARFFVNEVFTLEEACDTLVREVYIEIDRERCAHAGFDTLRGLAERYPGNRPLCLVIPGLHGGRAVLEAGAAYRISARPEVLRELRGQFGPGGVKLRVRDVEPPQRRRFERRDRRG